MVTFPGAVRLFFARYTDFQGRSRRSPWRSSVRIGSLPAVTSGVAHGGAMLALAADVNGDGLQDIVTGISGLFLT